MLQTTQYLVQMEHSVIALELATYLSATCVQLDGTVHCPTVVSMVTSAPMARFALLEGHNLWIVLLGTSATGPNLRCRALKVITVQRVPLRPCRAPMDITVIRRIAAIMIQVTKMQELVIQIFAHWVSFNCSSVVSLSQMFKSKTHIVVLSPQVIEANG